MKSLRPGSHRAASVGSVKGADTFLEAVDFTLKMLPEVLE